ALRGHAAHAGIRGTPPAPDRRGILRHRAAQDRADPVPVQLVSPARGSADRGPGSDRGCASKHPAGPPGGNRRALPDLPRRRREHGAAHAPERRAGHPRSGVPALLAMSLPASRGLGRRRARQANGRLAGAPRGHELHRLPRPAPAATRETDPVPRPPHPPNHAGRAMSTDREMTFEDVLRFAAKTGVESSFDDVAPSAGAGMAPAAGAAPAHGTPGRRLPLPVVDARAAGAAASPTTHTSCATGTCGCGGVRAAAERALEREIRASGEWEAMPFDADPARFPDFAAAHGRTPPAPTVGARADTLGAAAGTRPGSPDAGGTVLDKPVDRRRALGMFLGAVAAGTQAAAACAPFSPMSDEARERKLLEWAEYFKGNFRLMTDEEKAETIRRLERLAYLKQGVEVNIKATEAQPGVVFGYAFNISKCKGFRNCVEACIKENNLDRRTGTQYIRIFEMEAGEINLDHADSTFQHEVPAEAHFYLGTQC